MNPKNPNQMIQELVIQDKKVMSLMPNLFSKSIFHHGTCDICKEKHKLILHYNYDIQREVGVFDFNVCRDCSKLMVGIWNHFYKEVENGESE